MEMNRGGETHTDTTKESLQPLLFQKLSVRCCLRTMRRFAMLRRQRQGRLMHLPKRALHRSVQGFQRFLALSAFCAIKLLVRCWFLHRRHPRCYYWRDHYCRHRHHCCRCHHRPLFPRTSDQVRPRQYRRGNIRPRTIRRSAL